MKCPWPALPAPTVLLMGASLLAGCSLAPTHRNTTTPVVVGTLSTSISNPGEMNTPVQGPSAPTPGKDGPPTPGTIPARVAETPNAIVKPVHRTRRGNPPSYRVFGKVYHVRKTVKGFVQTGYASWYGRKFQGKLTASGERYDMFKMTAAHKTLPIPCYVRVTNLRNDRSVVVKVNDRGPFHSTRIIDLSYAAAARLKMLHHGTTRVRIRALTPKKTYTASSATDRPASSRGHAVTAAYHPGTAERHGGLFLQAGAFTDPMHAVLLQTRLQNEGIKPLRLSSNSDAKSAPVRVLIGPFADEQARHSMQIRLTQRKIPTIPVEQ